MSSCLRIKAVLDDSSPLKSTATSMPILEVARVASSHQSTAMALGFGAAHCISSVSTPFRGPKHQPPGPAGRRNAGAQGGNGHELRK